MSKLRVETYDRLDAAAQALSASSSARYLGGGTLVMRDLNDGDTRFDTIIRVTDPAFGRIQSSGDQINIGAGVTMAEVIASRELDFLAPVAKAIGGPAIRAMATVGGNLFAQHPYGDLGAAMLALDGRVIMAGGSTETALTDFFSRRDRMGRNLVASVSITRPANGDFRFSKVSRIKPKGVSLLSIAAYLPRTGGRVAGPRIAYGAMGPAPLRVVAVERALEGCALDTNGVATAVAVATEGLEPPDDPIASQWYRREVAPVYLRRLLLGEEDVR